MGPSGPNTGSKDKPDTVEKTVLRFKRRRLKAQQPLLDFWRVIKLEDHAASAGRYIILEPLEGHLSSVKTVVNPRIDITANDTAPRYDKGCDEGHPAVCGA